ncbi:hypothetical protein CCUG62472_04807 [Mycobacteroides salmoniphilum]|nr:hypothetical protein CCUG62472_04807 [Mycobacteroides salmoniphilum]
MTPGINSDGNQYMKNWSQGLQHLTGPEKEPRQTPSTLRRSLALVATAAVVTGVVKVVDENTAPGSGFSTMATVGADPTGPTGGPGGPGGMDGSQFQPPGLPPQMPDYQGGINQPPLDQNSGISIYNSGAQGAPQQGPGQQGAQQPQQSWDQPAHGTQIPDYSTAPGYTQGPGRPNPDAQGPQQGQQGQQNAPSQEPRQAPTQQTQQATPTQQSTPTQTPTTTAPTTTVTTTPTTTTPTTTTTTTTPSTTTTTTTTPTPTTTTPTTTTTTPTTTTPQRNSNSERSADVADKYRGRTAQDLINSGLMPKTPLDLSCANFVTTVLNENGMTNIGNGEAAKINVDALSSTLQSQNWTKTTLANAKPGDVWINPGAHTEMVFSNGDKVTLIGSNNDLPNGNQIVSIDKGSAYIPGTYILTPPA